MKQELQDYSNALNACYEAIRAESIAKDTTKKARHALLLAREALRMSEQQLLEDISREIK